MIKPVVVHLRTPAINNTGCSFAFSARRLRTCCLMLLLTALLASTHNAFAQGKYTLFGDLKVDESKVQGPRPSSFHVILYSQAGTVVGRQTVPAGGRYRFIGIRGGEYDLAVQVDNNEIARVRVIIGSSIDGEFSSFAFFFFFFRGQGLW